VHLNERLAYERISKQAKIRAEVSAAKRETEYFAKNVEISRRLKKQGFPNQKTEKVENGDLRFIIQRFVQRFEAYEGRKDVEVELWKVSGSKGIIRVDDKLSKFDYTANCRITKCSLFLPCRMLRS
jgi:hypothetical protein